MIAESDLEQIITKLIEGMGLSLVEMSIGRHRGDVKVNLVLYKEGGIGLNDLTLAQKVLRPRLELEFDRDDLSVEITSPGISRCIKNPREYPIFTGRRMKFLINNDWITGTLEHCDGETLSIDVDGERNTVALDAIRKAKLDWERRYTGQ